MSCRTNPLAWRDPHIAQIVKYEIQPEQVRILEGANRLLTI